jgi:ribosomal protein S18 acetylase RimI-like enzyme
VGGPRWRRAPVVTAAPFVTTGAAPYTLHSVTTEPGDVVVVEATEPSAEVLAAMHRLVPQLSSSASPLTTSELEEMVRSPASVLFVARDGDGTIVGTLTLALFRIPTGRRAWIEDVIVDDRARGAGVGAALVRAALEHAEADGVRSVDLTSRPDREAANRLYVRLGFETRRTNVYRHSAGPG